MNRFFGFDDFKVLIVFLESVSIRREGKMKLKTFRLLVFLCFFAFSKEAFSQNIETPSTSVPEQIEIQGYGKFLKHGEEFLLSMVKK